MRRQRCTGQSGCKHKREQCDWCYMADDSWAISRVPNYRAGSLRKDRYTDAEWAERSAANGELTHGG